MKKIWFLGLGFIASVSASAQFYISAQGGYGFGASKEPFFEVNPQMEGAARPFGGISITNFNGATTDTTETYSNIYGTFGGGTSFSVNAGYFKDNLGFDLGVSYLLGSKQTREEMVVNPSEGDFSDRSIAYTRQLRVEPSLLFRSEFTEKFSLMSKVGLVIPVMGATYGERVANIPSELTILQAVYEDAASLEAKSEIRGQFSIGYKMAISGNYQLTDNLELFGEVNYLSLRIRRKTYEVTDINVFDSKGNVATEKSNGELADKNNKTLRDLAHFRGSYYYTEYKEEINPHEEGKRSTEDGYGTKDNPNYQLQTDANFSALNFNVGIRYFFGGKGE